MRRSCSRRQQPRTTAAKVDLESAGEAFAAQREPAHKPAPVALLCGRLLLLLQVRDGPPKCEKRSERPSWRSKAVRGAAGWARWKHVSSAPCRVARELARRRWISMRGPWRCSGGRSPNSEETTERRRSIPVPSRVELDATRPEPLEPCGKRGGPRPRVVCQRWAYLPFLPNAWPCVFSSVCGNEARVLLCKIGVCPGALGCLAGSWRAQVVATATFLTEGIPHNKALLKLTDRDPAGNSSL